MDKRPDQPRDAVQKPKKQDRQFTDMRSGENDDDLRDSWGKQEAAEKARPGAPEPEETEPGKKK